MHLNEYIKTIDVNKFESVLKELAAENPSFRYIELGLIGASCRYNGPAKSICTEEVVGNPCSGCIFGQAFQREGVTEGLDTLETIGQIVESKVSSNVVKRWAKLQASQDLGDTWGEAIKCLDV